MSSWLPCELCGEHLYNNPDTTIKVQPRTSRVRCVDVDACNKRKISYAKQERINMSLRWSTTYSQDVENPDIDSFLAEIIEVYRRHNLSISHEDGEGAFIVTRYNEGNVDWLLNAQDGVSK